jgi:hypothetical protein
MELSLEDSLRDEFDALTQLYQRGRFEDLCCAQAYAG